VASGTRTTNSEVADLLVKQLGATVNFAPDAPVVSFPEVCTDLLRDEFSFYPRSFPESFAKLLEQMRNEIPKDDHDH
jgi:hypothetical protein